MAEGDDLVDQLMRFKPEGLSATSWAMKAGMGRSFWNDLKRHANPSRKTLERLLDVADTTLAEFEAFWAGKAPRVVAARPSPGVTDAGSAGWRAAPLTPVPLLETRLAGEWGEAGSGIELTEIHLSNVLGHVARPVSMSNDRDAYAITILGDSMLPRFRPGRKLLVSPGTAAAIGDDVVVQLQQPAGSDGVVKALIKELVRRAAGFVELRQYTPDVTFRVDASEVAVLHKVKGELV